MRIFFALDASGSMGIVKAQTISGFNEYIDTVKKSHKTAKITMATFNGIDRFKMVNDDEALSEAKHLNNESYWVDGTTPMYDAIGTMITRAKKLKTAREKAIIVIMTDGMENSSQEYDRKKVNKMINKLHKDPKWAVIYLGANQDAWEVGQTMGMREGQTITYNAANPRGATVMAAMATMSYADGEDPDQLLKEKKVD